MENIENFFREDPQKKENQEIQCLLENCRSKVKIIRNDPWPLINYDKDFSKFCNLSSMYLIPDFIISELFDIIKSFWFVDWLEVFLDEESQNIVNDWKKFVNDIIWNRENKDYENYSFILIDFFEKISTLKIFDKIKNQNIDSKDIPYWLFRFSSLFDIKVQNFSCLKEFLDFLYENLKTQEIIFWEYFLENIIGNWWLPIDDISWKEKILRNFKNNIFLWNLNLFWKNIWLIFRVLPGYWPSWLVFELWLDIDWKFNNIFATIWVSFQNTKAIIHTIQYSFYNIWLDFNWLIETDDKNKLISWKNLQKFISNIWDNIFEKDIKDKSPIKFLLSLTWNILQNFWIKKLEVINPYENLWLNNHNPNRDINSLRRSWELLYIEIPKSLFWKTNDENNRISLDLWYVQFFLSTQIKSMFIENFSQSMSNNYINSSFFKNSWKIECFSCLSKEQKDILWDDIYNIIKKIRNYV